MKRAVSIFLLCCLGTGGCAQVRQQNLYEALGGEPGVDTIVDNLVTNIGQDTQIFHYFADADVSHFREFLALHLCDVADGSCTYDGDSLVDIHTGMQINESDFNHLVDLLIDAMNEADVAHPVQNRLLARLAPMRRDIIYK